MDVAEIDGASNRGIDEIRDLREAVRFLPMKCKYKVYIIDEVHMLTEHAFNALLKTLEEPPEYVIFILATTDPHRIPATIISRCQKYDFNKIPYDVMYKSLENALNTEGVTYDPDALSLVVRNSDGCMRDSLSLLDQIIAFTGGTLDEQNTSFLLGYSDKSIMNRLFEAVIKENTQDIPQICAELTAKGINFTFAAETLIEHTRNLMMRIITKKDNSELTSKENEFYGSLAQATSEQRLFALFQVFQKLLNDIKFFSFSQYVFEFGMYKAASISALIPTSGMAPTVPMGNAPVSAPAGAPRPATPAPQPMIQKPQAETSAKPMLSTTDIQLQNIMKTLEDGKQPLIASNLSHGYIIQQTGGVLSIGFSADKKFHYDYIVRKQNLDTINQIVSQNFPSITEVSVTLEQDSKKKSIIEKKEHIETIHDITIKKEAEQDSIVKLLLNEFDGRVLDIDVLQRPSFDVEEDDTENEDS
jgi:DNA polymerase-3 subunit gamma/tau